MKKILDHHLTKQAVIGAAIGAVGGLLFGSLAWTIGLTLLGAGLAVAIDLIDKAIYKPESQGGGQHTVALIGVILVILGGAITAVLFWLATS
jgi:hypothetical protein